MTSIGTDVFGGCTALGQITVAPGNAIYDSRNNCNAIIMTSANKLITGCKNTVIPNTVTVIGNSAFYSCTGLSGALNIPNSVITIESNAFYGCSGITGLLNIPNSVTTIAASAFQYCTGITSATIPSSVISIGNKAFRDCSGLITLNYNATNCSVGSNYWYYYSSDYQYHWLYGCSSLVSLNIGDGVQTIPYCFVCSRYGNSLTGSIVIPNSVTSIGNYAFYGCSNIGSVSIGNSVTSIGENAFNSCSNMGSLTIGNSVASIGSYAFANCSNLTTVVLPSSMTSISNHTFNSCSLLSSVTIPNTIVSIGNYAFGYTALASVVIPNSVVSISEGAFYNCSSLASVSIGESVASIGASAFYNCSNIASMSVYADNPPVVFSNAFYNVSTSIPVQIPCSTLSAYQAASVWNSFTNLQEMDCLSHTVTVAANPTAGGTLTGGGSYTHGTSCTVTATANDGYTFLNWQENGQVVSTDAVYTFNAMGDRDLVARFLLVGNHWTPESANYSENMGLYGVIQIDGVEQRSDMLEVGAFCGNECRGTAIASLFDLTNHYLAIMTIFGDDADPITFKLYDHDTNQELELSSPEAITFNIDGYGTPVEPYVLNFVSTVEITATIDPMGAGTVTGTGDYAPGATCTLTAVANDGFQFTHWTLNGTEVSTEPSFTFTVTGFANYVAHFQYMQTRSLVNGWNWYSTYIEQNGINGLEMLENSLGTAGVRIQGRNGIVDQFEYQGSYSWYGTLNSITNEQMYKIRTNAACNAVMTGSAAAASSHPITINSGWNWIGFPSRQSISVATAVSNFTPEGDDVIKGRNGFTTYIAGTNIWYGTLNMLEPGQGYMYKSNSSTSKTLVFNTGRTEEEVVNVTSENNIFVPNDAEFADNMLITAVIDINGEELASDEYELAAFVGDECRGSVKLMYVEPMNRYVAFLTVFGASDENLHFVLTNGTETRWSSDMMVYTADAIIGTLSEPATIEFGTTGLNDNAQVNAVVYPNPSNGVFNVKCEGIQKVEVVNVYGQVVVSKEVRADDIQIDLGDKANGAYMLRIVTDNGVVVKNLIKNN